MGASSWSYTVPYQEDIGVALQQLRAQVFRDGTYYGAGHTSASTPDEALRLSGEDGTHSILDIYRGIAEVPGFGVAAPLGAEALIAVFGTERPSLQAVEQATARDPMLGRGRWEGSYVVAYEGGSPRWIHFSGVSGD